ncbi:MAG: universal stress protein [Nitrospiraceae bacterium]|nr:universal stress protein [Nitrospiraceae bacterium]
MFEKNQKNKKILVPLDGSGMAEAVLPAAAYMSCRLNATVTLFHVIEKDAPSEVHGQRHLKDPKEAEAYLKDVSIRIVREIGRIVQEAGESIRKEGRAFPGEQMCPEGARADFHVHTAKAENVAASIIEHARELGCDLVIMCSHGRGRALNLLLGSIAQKVTAKGESPVLLIRPAADEGAVPFSCQTLLLPLDGNPEHEQAVPVAVELAKACGSVLHIAVVVPDFETLSGQSAVTSRFLPGTMSEMLEMSVQDAEEYIRNQLETIRERGAQAKAHLLRGDPATVINDLALRVRAGLIVMATHGGKSAMDAFWDGNVPHKISSLSRVPLLLVPVRGNLANGQA